jgi:hypothetical protein
LAFPNPYEPPLSTDEEPPVDLEQSFLMTIVWISALVVIGSVIALMVRV